MASELGMGNSAGQKILAGSENMFVPPSTPPESLFYEHISVPLGTFVRTFIVYVSQLTIRDGECSISSRLSE